MIYYKYIIYLLSVLTIFNAESYFDDEYRIEMIFIEYNEVLLDDEAFTEGLYYPDESVINLQSKNLFINKNDINNNDRLNSLTDALSGIKINNSRSEWFNKNNDLQSLNIIHQNLKYRKGISIIDRVSWIQPITSFNNAKYVYYQNPLIGTYIKLYKSRYLHLNIKSFVGDLSKDNKELVLDEYINSSSYTVTNDSYDDKIKNKKISLKKDNNLIHFIDEEMRLFNEEIYFLDHPRFGIFLNIKKINP